MAFVNSFWEACEYAVGSAEVTSTREGFHAQCEKAVNPNAISTCSNVSTRHGSFPSFDSSFCSTRSEKNGELQNAAYHPVPAKQTSMHDLPLAIHSTEDLETWSEEYSPLATLSESATPQPFRRWSSIEHRPCAEDAKQQTSLRQKGNRNVYFSTPLVHNCCCPSHGDSTQTNSSAERSCMPVVIPSRPHIPTLPLSTVFPSNTLTKDDDFWVAMSSLGDSTESTSDLSSGRFRTTSERVGTDDRHRSLVTSSNARSLANASNPTVSRRQVEDPSDSCLDPSAPVDRGDVNKLEFNLNQCFCSSIELCSPIRYHIDQHEVQLQHFPPSATQL